MRNRIFGLLGILLAFAMFAAACGSDTAIDTSATDAANAAAQTAKDEAAAAQTALEELQAQQNASEADLAAAMADAEAAKDAQTAAEDSAAEAEAAAKAAEEAAMADDSSSGPAVVRITGTERSEAEAGAIQQTLNAWSADKNIVVQYLGSADWEAEINTQVQGGTQPDIAIFPQPGKLADFVAEGYMTEVSDEVNAASTAVWSDAWRSFGTVDGGQYGVPIKADAKSLVWYKPTVFDDNGYDIPQSWDELVALSDTMIADGITPWCIGIESGQATGWLFTDWVEDLVLRFDGPEVYDEWVANDVKFADERIVEVFQTILDLWNTPDAVFAAGGSIAATHFASDPAEGLIADDCAMVRQASFFSGFLPEGSSDQVSVFYFPSADDTKPVLGGGTLAAAFNDRPETMQVLEYMAGAEYGANRQQIQTALKAGGLSGFLSAASGQDEFYTGEGVLYAPIEQDILDILQGADVVRFDGSDLMPADVGAGTFWTEAVNMVDAGKDPAEAAADIDASWP